MRGHRSNIFNDDFKSVGIFTGEHKKYRTETVLDYNGSLGEVKTVPKTVEFGPDPAGSVGWSQKSQVKHVGGTMYQKTTTRTYKMRDGSIITKVIKQYMDN